MNTFLPVGNRKVESPVYQLRFIGGFPGGAVVKNTSCSARDTGSAPGLGRSHMPWDN